MSAKESKPEWFQMADQDWAASPQAFKAGVKSRRKNPVQMMAISAPILVLGAGLFFAQTQSAPTSFASSTTAVSTASTNPSSLASGAVIESTTPVANDPASTTPATSAPKAASAPAQIGFAPISNSNGGLVLPAKSSVQSDDDGDDDHGSDDGDDENEDD